MRKVLETSDLEEDLDKLPKRIRRIYFRQKKRFKQNRFDPRLHVKKLKGMEGVYSFRVTRRYRVLFYFRKKDTVFFKIGHRKDVYKDI